MGSAQKITSAIDTHSDVLYETAQSWKSHCAAFSGTDVCSSDVSRNSIARSYGSVRFDFRIATRCN